MTCPPDDMREPIELTRLPPPGMHFLQVQNPGGRFSNDFIFHVTQDARSAEEIQRRWDEERSPTGGALATAITRGDLEGLRKLVAAGESIDARDSQGGSTPLSVAARGWPRSSRRPRRNRTARIGGERWRVSENGSTMPS